jgi:hypothetical protein
MLIMDIEMKTGLLAAFWMCLWLGAAQADASNCPASLSVVGDEESWDGQMVHGSSKRDKNDNIIGEECLKADMQRQGDEFRQRTTSINADGTANPRGEDSEFHLGAGEKPVLRLDDHMKGSQAQFGGDWLVNAQTSKLPKPEMPAHFVSTAPKDSLVTVLFNPDELGVEKMKVYAEMLKTWGFTVDPKTKELSEEVRAKWGMRPTFSYEAKNSAGYWVKVSCLGDGCSLELKDAAGAQRMAKQNADRKAQRAGH